MKFKVFFYDEHENVNDGKLKPFIEVDAEHATSHGNIVTLYNGSIESGKVKGIFNLNLCFVAENDSTKENK